MGFNTKTPALMLAALFGGIGTAGAQQAEDDYNLGVNDDYFLDQPAPTQQAQPKPAPTVAPKPVVAAKPAPSTGAVGATVGAVGAAAAAATAAGSAATAATAGAATAATPASTPAPAPVVVAQEEEKPAPAAAPAPTPTVVAVAPRRMAPPEEEETGPLPPLATQRATDYTSEVAIAGTRYNGATPFFGRFNGVTESGTEASFDMHLAYRPDADSEDVSYWGVDIYHPSSDIAYIDGVWGQQGVNRVDFSYHQLQWNDGLVAMSPYVGVGGSELTLPASWVHDSSTSNMTALPTTLQEVNFGKSRDRVSASYKHDIAGGWSFDANVSRDTKEGIKPLGVISSNFRGAIVAQPTDYTTDDITFGVGYQQPGAQYRVYYNLSTFKNDHDEFLVDSPNASGSVSGMSLPPDNEAQRMGFKAGWQTPRTSSSVEFVTGTTEQNEDFMPMTTNTAVTIPTPLTDDSLEGELETTQVLGSFNFRPTRSTTLNARYRFDERENKTEEREYGYLAADSSLGFALGNCTPPANSRCIETHGYSSTKQRIDLDLKQRFGYKHTVTFGLTQEEIEREAGHHLEVEQTTEDIYRLGYRGRFGGMTSFGAKISMGEREYDEYEEPEEVSDNNPDMRKFFFANRERERVQLDLRISPPSNFSFGVNADMSTDEYPDSDVGVTESELSTITADFTQMASEQVSWSLFVTRADSSFEEVGQADATDVDTFWSMNGETSTDTIGLHIDWVAIPDVMDVIFEATSSESAQSAKFDAGAGLTVSDLPDNDTEWTSLGISANFHVAKNMTMSAGYTREEYEASDWMIDGVAVDSINNVLSLGQESPEYTVNIYQIAMRYYF